MKRDDGNIREGNSDYNGEVHGELYSPDYSVNINTDSSKTSDEGQGELYSPESALRISASTHTKSDSHKQQQLRVSFFIYCCLLINLLF